MQLGNIIAAKFLSVCTSGTLQLHEWDLAIEQSLYQGLYKDKNVLSFKYETSRRLWL